MSYGLKYKLPFYDLENESYEIRIYKEDFSGSVTELEGGKPAIVTQSESEDFLYTPWRAVGATLQIAGKNYLQDLFSVQYQECKVNLIKTDGNKEQIIWTGFVIPESYSQQYTGATFVLEVECVSALSTLEYIKFEKETEIISLLQLVKDAFRLSRGDYQNIYIPCTWQNMLRNEMSEMFISSNNFIDEEGEGMSYKEILSEICKFFGWTLTEKNGNAYFIDIDYMKKGNDRYFRYDSSFNESSVFLDIEKIHIEKSDSCGDDDNKEILGGYNKINVVCSDYEFGKGLFPDIETEEYQNRRKLGALTGSKEMQIKEYFDCNLELFRYTKIGTGTGFWQPAPKMWRYDGENVVNEMQYAGAYLNKYATYDTEDIPNRLNYSNQIEIKLFDSSNYDNQIATDNVNERPTNDTAFIIAKMKSPSPAVLITSDMKLAVDFKIEYSANNFGYHEEYVQTYIGWQSADWWYVPIELRVGEWYYNGISWQNSKTYFKVFTDMDQRYHYTDKQLSARDTITWMDGVPDLTGTLINVSFDMLGDFEVTIYCPRQVVLADTGGRDWLNRRYIYLTDFKIESQKVNKNFVDKKKEDTLYTNVVNENYINEAEDIELKITSKNDSELSFSKVLRGNSVLDKLHCNLTGQAEKPEEFIIKRVVNQYNTTKIKTIQTIKNKIEPFKLVTDYGTPGKDFVMTGETVDYSTGFAEVILIEVK